MGMKNHSTADALFSKVQQRVLGVLFTNPDKYFYTNEIIRLSNSGTGAVQRELVKLSTAQLVAIKKVGNQKLYQANRANPLFDELQSIIIKTFGMGDILRNTLETYASHIFIAFIYGSVAKHTDTAESDIDILIISDSLSYTELLPQIEKAEKKLSRPIHPTVYTIADWQRKLKQKNNFILQITNQPKIFLIGTDNDLKQLG